MTSSVLSPLNPAGPVAQAIADTAWVLIVGAAAVFAVLMLLLAWALFRRGPGPVPDEQTLFRRWIVGGGLLFPGVVLAALLVHTGLQTAALSPPRTAAEPVIGVVGHLWWWEVQVRDEAGGASFALANEIHLPAGRAVTIGLTSADVIHSLWVPALAGKVDMLPGRVHQLRLQADRPGVYRGQCAEFCGDQHARMALTVVVHDAGGYRRWLAAQARPATAPSDLQAMRGAEVYRALRCAACHDVRGLVPGGAIGPDLTHVASRLHLGAGALPMSAAGLAQWVVHNQRVKPGVRMPSYEQLDAASLQALVAFLEHLH